MVAPKLEIVMWWPERYAAMVAAVIAGLFLLVWTLLSIAAGSPFAPRLDLSVMRWMTDVEAVVVLPLWLVLRAVYHGRIAALRLWHAVESRQASASEAPEPLFDLTAGPADGPTLPKAV